MMKYYIVDVYNDAANSGKDLRCKHKYYESIYRNDKIYKF